MMDFKPYLLFVAAVFFSWPLVRCIVNFGLDERRERRNWSKSKTVYYYHYPKVMFKLVTAVIITFTMFGLFQIFDYLVA